jgi:hypothetical protein
MLSIRHDNASGEAGFTRDIFCTRVIPADSARAEAAPAAAAFVRMRAICRSLNLIPH